MCTGLFHFVKRWAFFAECADFVTNTPWPHKLECWFEMNWSWIHLYKIRINPEEEQTRGVLACIIALGIQRWWMNKKPASSRPWLAGNKPLCQITQSCQSKIRLIILTGAALFPAVSRWGLVLCPLDNETLVSWFIFQFWDTGSVLRFFCPPPTYEICAFFCCGTWRDSSSSGSRTVLLIWSLFKAAPSNTKHQQSEGEGLFTIRRN